MHNSDFTKCLSLTAILAFFHYTVHVHSYMYEMQVTNVFAGLVCMTEGTRFEQLFQDCNIFRVIALYLVNPP